MGTPGEERKEQGKDLIIVENFPKLMTESKPQIKEAEGIPSA